MDFTAYIADVGSKALVYLWILTQFNSDDAGILAHKFVYSCAPAQEVDTNL